MNNNEACLTFKKDVTLGLVAGYLTFVENWMGTPVVITVIILGKNKVRAIMDARERYRQEMSRKTKDKGSDEIKEKLERVVDEKDRLVQDMAEYYGKQKNLEKLVESLNDKIQRLETQPIGGQAFTTSSTQNLSGSFENLTTSFQVKADMDLGKFSGVEPVPNNELIFNQ